MGSIHGQGLWKKLTEIPLRRTEKLKVESLKYGFGRGGRIDLKACWVDYYKKKQGR
jgi:hypothetical protein